MIRRARLFGARSLADQRGNAAAELALMLPFITVLLFGTVEIGYFFYTEHQVVKGVRDGARYGGRQSFADINCDDASVPDDIEDAIQQVTMTGRASGGTVRVPGWEAGDVTVAVDCPATPVTGGIYSDESNAPTVVVSTTVEHTPLFGSFPGLPESYTLQASQQSAVMGI